VSHEGAKLFESGRYEEALVTFQQAAAEHRGQPDELDLAADLNNVGMCLGKLRRFEEAVEPFREATDIWARQWQADESLAPYYAAAMASLAGALTEVRRFEEALDVTSVVVFLRRSEPSPGNVDLAKALRQFAYTRALAGQDLDRALPAAREAVTLYRDLATAAPQDHLPEWHLAGHVLASILDGLDRTTEATQVRAQLALARQSNGSS
jgi:tetratricopeptide (TPR) repeat protein